MFGKIRQHGRTSNINNHSVSPTKALLAHSKNKQANTTPQIHTKKQKKQQKLKMKDQELTGSQFRILNELLYTNDSRAASEYFQNNRQHFNVYHEGFRRQSEGWNVKPVDVILSMLKSKDLKQAKIIDLGCGDAKIEQQLTGLARKVRSYDLIATKPCVIVADIAHLPLKSNTQDYAVFCLSLMGTNYIEFILEADRVLKSGGRLIIAEVESRCKYWDRFEAMIGYLGYECVGRSLSKYFRVLTFEKSHEPNNLTRQIINQPYGQSNQTLLEVSQALLQPCIYKKR